MGEQLAHNPPEFGKDVHNAQKAKLSQLGHFPSHSGEELRGALHSST